MEAKDFELCCGLRKQTDDGAGGGSEQDGRQLAKPLKLNGWGAKAAVPERTKYRPVFIHVDDASRCPREPEPQGRLAELLKDIIVAKRGGSSAVAKSKTSPRLFNNTQ